MKDLEARVCELEATVAALRDRAEIQDLRFRYHIAVNEKELDSIGPLFSADGSRVAYIDNVDYLKPVIWRENVGRIVNSVPLP